MHPNPLSLLAALSVSTFASTVAIAQTTASTTPRFTESAFPTRAFKLFVRDSANVDGRVIRIQVTDRTNPQNSRVLVDRVQLGNIYGSAIQFSLAQPVNATLTFTALPRSTSATSGSQSDVSLTLTLEDLLERLQWTRHYANVTVADVHLTLDAVANSSDVAHSQTVSEDCDDLRQALMDDVQPARQPNPAYVGFGGNCYNCYPFIDSPGTLAGHTAEDIDKMSCNELLALAQAVGHSESSEATKPQDPSSKGDEDQDTEAALARWILASRDHIGPWTVADDQDALDNLARALGLNPPYSDYPKASGDSPWERAKEIGSLWASFVSDELITTIFASSVPRQFKRVVGLAGFAATVAEVWSAVGDSVRIATRHGPSAEQQAASDVKVRRERLDALGDRLNRESQRTGGNNSVIEEAQAEFWKIRREYNI